MTNKPPVDRSRLRAQLEQLRDTWERRREGYNEIAAIAASYMREDCAELEADYSLRSVEVAKCLKELAALLVVEQPGEQHEPAEPKACTCPIERWSARYGDHAADCPSFRRTEDR